jgi:hypothetical protein
MSGKWSLAGVPHKGWSCVGVEDFGAPDEYCEMCANQPIRYGHFMRHPSYPKEVVVGCVCAEKMEEDYSAPRERESKLKNIAVRRKRWLTRKWRVSKNGNEFLRTDGLVITIFQNSNGKWGGSIIERVTDQKSSIRNVFDTSELAKLAVFDDMIKLKSEQGWGK